MRTQDDSLWNSNHIQISSRLPQCGIDLERQRAGTGEADRCELGTSQRQPLGAQPSAWWCYDFSTGEARRDQGLAWCQISDGRTRGFCSPYWHSHHSSFALACFQFPDYHTPPSPKLSLLNCEKGLKKLTLELENSRSAIFITKEACSPICQEKVLFIAIFVFRIVIICLHKQRAGRTASIVLSPQSETTVPFVVLNFKTAADLSGWGRGGGQSINMLCCQETKKKKKSKILENTYFEWPLQTSKARLFI